MYDLIIIGAGTAGMTASLYASRYKIRHLIFGELPGGQGTTAHLVENYPGFKSISGPELMQRFVEQVQGYSVKIRAERVIRLAKVEVYKKGKGQEASLENRVRVKKPVWKLGEEVSKENTNFLTSSPNRPPNPNLTSNFCAFTNKAKYQTRSLILAMGAGHRVLNVPGEEKFAGRGVSYCTTCDVPLFRDKVVAVVGGGDSAVTGALHAADLCSKVYLIHRRGEFRAEPVWLERLKKKKNVGIILNGVVKEVYGEGKVEGIKVETKEDELPAFAAPSPKRLWRVGDKATAGRRNLEIDGLFIEIGQIPASVLSGELGVKLNKERYILVDAKYQTNVPGVFAAGDLTYLPGSIPFRQFITSAAEGARAAAAVYEYLKKENPAPNWGA